MRLRSWVCAIAGLAGWVAAVGGEVAAPAKDAATAHVLHAMDLRGTDAKGEVNALRSLWRDRLDKATAQRGANKPALPAFTLSHMFDSARPKVFVSILFDMVDCELPGNGDGADLYARCPMRIVTGSIEAPRIKTVEGICNLEVPPMAQPGDGPDPAKNYTTVSMDESRTVHLRVVQYGRPLPSCNADIKVD